MYPGLDHVILNYPPMEAGRGQIHGLSRRALAALLRDDSDTDLCGWLKIAAVRAYAWTSKKELQGKIEN